MSLRVLAVVAVLMLLAASSHAFSTMDLPVRASVTAHLQYAEESRGIAVVLCGSRNCSALLLKGQNESGALHYTAYSGCDIGYGPYAPNCAQEKEEPCKESRDFPPGAVELEISHRPGELLVWRKNMLQSVARVAVGPDYRHLRVGPFLHFNEVFTMAAPINAPDITFPLWHAETRMVRVALCDRTHCTRVFLVGRGEDGDLTYTSGKGCNRFLEMDNCSDAQYNRQVNARLLPLSYGDLAVSSPPGELRVWQKDKPSDVVRVALPARANYSTLSVAVIDTDTSNTPVEFTEFNGPDPRP